MKVVRIVQLLLVLVLIGYLLILHNLNPQTIILPFLFALPTALVLTVAIILSFLVGWGVSLGRIFGGLTGRIGRLERRLIELGGEPLTPVIPDRTADGNGKKNGKKREKSSSDTERASLR